MANILRQVLRQSLVAPRHYLSAAPVAIRSFSSKTGAPTITTTSSSGEKPISLDKNTLKQLVGTNKVVIFMKGNPEAPRCGFSNAVVQILRMHGVQYDAHDVLLDEALRQGVKDFTEWPTIPQVFINGEFVGGCDILLQMHQNGDLIEELKKAGIESLLLKQAEAQNEQQTTSTQDVKK